MNKVIYGSYTFQDSDLSLLTGGHADLYWSPLGDELRAAGFSIPVQFVPKIWHVPAEDFKSGVVYGDPVEIYEDDTLLRRFYLTDIAGGQRQQDGSYIFELIGTDFVGLFASVQHLGGMYENASAGNVIADILGAVQTASDTDETTYEVSGITYKVDAAVVNARIDNWLPETKDARENLRNVLQLVNASVVQDADGTPRIAVIDNGSPIVISPYEIYEGDEYTEETPVTAVQVVEYAFFKVAGTAAETLFDGSVEGVNNDLIIFDRPYYEVQGDADLTVHEWGANFARITGTGKLTGKPYVQATRTLAASTGLTGADNTKTIDNTLCSALYSSNLLVRMTRYFAAIEIVRHAVAMPEHYVPGQTLQFSDPMNEDKVGYPIEMSLTFSGLTKSDELVTANWQPAEETPFTQSELITEDGTWTPPEGATRLRFVLIGGGKGGWGGYPGQAGQGSYFNPSTEAGDGGEVGEGGDGGKVLQINVEYDQILASYSVQIGAAGTAGAINHGEGTEGGDTTLTAGDVTYSSANGVKYPYGVFDVLTGVRYAAKGQNGIYPGNSGVGLNYPYQKSITDTQTSQTGTTTTWNDGTSNSSPYTNGGGGAAYGENGANASAAWGGGKGADAVLDGFNGYIAGPPTIPGTGGIGGNGGGGGGCGGYNSSHSGLSGGGAGAGSVGGPPAAGAILVLIAFGTPPTPVNDGLLFDANGEAMFDANYERLKEGA